MTSHNAACQSTAISRHMTYFHSITLMWNTHSVAFQAY